MDTEQRLEQLETFVAMLMASDRYTFQKTLQLFDGRNIQFAKGTGTKIGTEVTQKLAFYGSTPIVQPSTAGTTGNESLGGGAAIPDGTAYRGYTNSGKAYTPQDVVGALKAIGILAP